MYASEDAFARLPIHWMWWPAIGGAIIGIGGLIEPRALGVGYDVIDQLLTGRAGISLIVGILVVKTLIWGLSLGSGTSGGVLAPVFMIGGALGALEGHILPGVTPGFWALVGLAAVVGGVMRSPLTGVVFPLELTHAWPLLLPLLIAATAAYTVSALLLKRSVLTEKVARRGLHLSREYAVDPLEVLLVDEVMDARADHRGGRRDAAPAQCPGRPAAAVAVPGHRRAVRPAGGHPPPGDSPNSTAAGPRRAGEIGTRLPGSSTYPDETLREVARRFASEHLTTAVVLDRNDPSRVVGLITVEHLLQARLRDLVHERHRERFLLPRRGGAVRSELVGRAEDPAAAAGGEVMPAPGPRQVQAAGPARRVGRPRAGTPRRAARPGCRSADC